MTTGSATGSLKRESTLIARGALAGYAITRTEADDGRTVWVLTRWAMTRQLDSLDAVERWLDQSVPEWRAQASAGPLEALELPGGASGATQANDGCTGR
jgi:hypothetical protein